MSLDRPDLSVASKVLARGMSKPSDAGGVRLKRILIYIYIHIYIYIYIYVSPYTSIERSDGRNVAADVFA